MLREDIIEKISKYFKLTSYEAEKIYDDIFSMIISGVKQDNIVDLTNFGEFIIKYNEGNGAADSQGYKKTAEFLATSKLEEEVNQSAYERSLTHTVTVTESPAPPVEEHKSTEVSQIQNENHISEQSSGLTSYNFEEPEKKEEKPLITEVPVFRPPLIETPPVIESKIIQQPVEQEPKSKIEETEYHKVEGESSVEEEMRLKREQILSKLTKPLIEKKPLDQVKPYVPLINLPNKEAIKPLFTQQVKETELNPPVEEKNKEAIELPKIEPVVETAPILEEFVPEPILNKTEEADEFSKKSFSDFFTEVKHEENKIEEPVPVNEEKHIEEPILQHVIPPSVVELHNEISGTTQHELTSFPTAEVPKAPISTNGNGISNGEYRATDNSYYIWYKDVEANAADTQNLSFEYELLYQATKEAEYKSKLKIYVTTFIIFFSIVLVLLIFSPVIYKVFFKPIEPPVNTENVTPDKQSSEQFTPDNKANRNVLTQETPQQQQMPTEQNNQTVPPPVTDNQQQTPPQQQQIQQQAPQQQQTQQQAPPQQQTQQQTTQQQPQQNTEPKLDGVTKNSMGWMDDKLKVIYVKLDNGKYTIQESAWDSDLKANKRISTVLGYKIDGMKGSVFKVDLGGKGTWFRARFGEFTTLEEAKVKAEELRNKERSKLQAGLLFFLLYA